MKSEESLESRLTAFLVESTLRLADLIRADVFVIVDSASATSVDGVGSDSMERPSRLRIWSGASSLRSAFLRGGLRARDSDVEYGRGNEAGYGRTDLREGGLECGFANLQKEKESTASFTDTHSRAKEGSESVPFKAHFSSDSASPFFQPSPHLPESETSSSSRRKRRQPTKRKTILSPKFLRLNFDDDAEIYERPEIPERRSEDGEIDSPENCAGRAKDSESDNDNHPEIFKGISINANRDDRQQPEMLKGDEKLRLKIFDGDASDLDTLPLNLSVVSSSSSIVPFGSPFASSSTHHPPLLPSRSLPTPNSPNPPSTPLPALDTGSSPSTLRELFDFSPRFAFANDIAAPTNRAVVAENGAASGLMDLTPPDRHGDDEDGDRIEAPPLPPPLDGVAELEMASARASVRAAYGMTGSTHSGSNDDFYANITQSLFSMLSHYPHSTTGAMESKLETTAEIGDAGALFDRGGKKARGSGRDGGEEKSRSGGKGRRGGGGSKKRKEIASTGEEKIDALFSEKEFSVDGSTEGEERNKGLNGSADYASEDSAKPGGEDKLSRSRGNSHVDSKRGQKSSSSSHARRPFTCSLCKKTFTRKDTCREHLKRIHFREVLHCQVCNMAFNSRQTMWFHRKKTGHQYEIVNSAAASSATTDQQPLEIGIAPSSRDPSL